MSRVFDAAQVGANLQTIITPSAAVYNNMQAWTQACWVFPTASLPFSTLMIKDPQVTYSIAIDLQSLQIQAFGNYTIGTPQSRTDATLPLNTWSQITATFDNAGDKLVHIYINGVEGTYVSQTAASGTIIDDSANGWVFGSDTFNGDSLTGRLAEVAIWNTALTSGQAATLAASSTGAAGVATANLVGYWHLCGFNSPEPDATVNGNDGVLSTNPPTANGNSPGFTCVPPIPPPPVLPWSSTDSRNFGNFPNTSRTINLTKTYDVQTSSNMSVPGTDSRTAGAPTDDRITPNIPENSRTPGTFGPGE